MWNSVSASGPKAARRAGRSCGAPPLGPPGSGRQGPARVPGTTPGRRAAVRRRRSRVSWRRSRALRARKRAADGRSTRRSRAAMCARGPRASRSTPAPAGTSTPARPRDETLEGRERLDVLRIDQLPRRVVSESRYETGQGGGEQDHEHDAGRARGADRHGVLHHDRHAGHAGGDEGPEEELPVVVEPGRVLEQQQVERALQAQQRRSRGRDAPQRESGRPGSQVATQGVRRPDEDRGERRCHAGQREVSKSIGPLVREPRRPWLASAQASE
jgi:hypothetical protein